MVDWDWRHIDIRLTGTGGTQMVDWDWRHIDRWLTGTGG